MAEQSGAVFRRFSRVSGPLVSLAVLVTIDLGLGLALGDHVPYFKLALPPYSLLHNEAQRRGLREAQGCYACFSAQTG